MTDAPKFDTGGIVPQTMFTTSGVPSGRPDVRVSKQEQLLYGQGAGLIRRLGDAAQALEDAVGLAELDVKGASDQEAERRAGEHFKAIRELADLAALRYRLSSCGAAQREQNRRIDDDGAS
jgi:hypothetical protein